MKKRVYIIISGNVQGVFYRVNARKKAKEFGLTGWVKNTRDNKVEILAEGEEENLQRMIEWCYNGSENAIVKEVKIGWEDYENKFDLFEIIV